MRREHALQLAGSTVLLLADKALYWPQGGLLCIADAHFGKAAAYRALGQPVPQGTTATNLLRLDVLLASYPTSHLVFLGDFLHARQSQSNDVLAPLHSWRHQHAGLRMTLVRGNHDLRAGDPPATLRIEIVNQPLLAGPFALRHTPAPQAGQHVIAGHVHPVFRLHGLARQQLRLPCFHSTPSITLLPSFGEFTGGHRVVASLGDRIFVTDGSSVWAVPPQQRIST